MTVLFFSISFLLREPPPRLSLLSFSPPSLGVTDCINANGDGWKRKRRGEELERPLEEEEEEEEDLLGEDTDCECSPAPLLPLHRIRT